VPEVLRSGNHALVERWRREQALIRTWERRPELLQRAKLSEKEWQFVHALQAEKDRDPNT
jgi:tRNA (guanine37-N1)-methyltransferase